MGLCACQWALDAEDHRDWRLTDAMQGVVWAFSGKLTYLLGKGSPNRSCSTASRHSTSALLSATSTRWSFAWRRTSGGSQHVPGARLHL